MNLDIIGFLYKPKTPGYCRFLLSNPNDASIGDFVPKSNPVNILILLRICSANHNDLKNTVQKLKNIDRNRA